MTTNHHFQPIQLREDVPDQKQRIEKLGVYHSDAAFLKEIVNKAIPLEKGLFVARDVGKLLRILTLCSFNSSVSHVRY